MKTLKIKHFHCNRIILLVSLMIMSCSARYEKSHKPTNTHFNKYPQGNSIQLPDYPERIILNLTETPDTSQAVTWRTRSTTVKPQAQLAPVTEFIELEKAAKTVLAVTEKVKTDSNIHKQHHTVHFRQLKPDTLYAYRVGNGNLWSEWNQFRTADSKPEPFKFIYFGDFQNQVHSLCPRDFRAAYKKAPDARFGLFVGDLVNDGEMDREWADFFDAIDYIPRMLPIVLIPGNHEYPNRRYIALKDFKLTPLWRPHFTLPKNGPEDLAETVYFFDYQGVRDVRLNGNEKIQEQAEWLDKILSNNAQSWTITAIHQPGYSPRNSRKNLKLKQFLAPIFDKHSVDLVLQGHDHSYARSFRIKNGIRIQNNQMGTTYITSISGPKSYGIDSPNTKWQRQ